MSGSKPTAIECKWTANNFDPGNLKLFCKTYTKGDNYVVSSDVDVGFTKQYEGLTVSFVSLQELLSKIVLG